jgi:hypothetical protein
MPWMNFTARINSRSFIQTKQIASVVIKENALTENLRKNYKLTVENQTKAIEAHALIAERKQTHFFSIARSNGTRSNKYKIRLHIFQTTHDT